MEKNVLNSERNWKDSEELVRAATKKMSDLAGPLDDWKYAGEKENVKIYTKFTEGTFKLKAKAQNFAFSESYFSAFVVDSPIKMIRAETFGIPASVRFSFGISQI
jgi:hypothetical protein